jgi:hypothetical protein
MRKEALYVAADLGPIVPLTRQRTPCVPFSQASADPEVIYEWWTRWPEAGIGVAAWLTSLMVIDVEHPAKAGDDGFATLRMLEEVIGTLPTTRTHATKTGGRHYVFALPRTTTIRSSQGAIRGRDLSAPGIDIVSDRAVLRWPPTPGYTLETDTEVALLSDAWIGALVDPPVTLAPHYTLPTDTDQRRRYAITALANEAADLASLGDGRRVALNTAAFKLGQLSPPLMVGEITDALVSACHINGSLRMHGQRFCEQTILRSIRAGMKQPRRVAA